jgi:tetratricopeptide (TPR) repeat protein
MPSATKDPAPALTRNALIPLSIVTCFVLVYVVQAPPYWVIPIGLFVMALYLVAPMLGKRSLARFDRELVQLLARGKKAELSSLFNGAIGMRLFAAPALVQERKGLVAAELGDAARARDAYRLAIDGYGKGEAPLAVRLGLAHASFALGQDEEAIAHYRTVLRDAPELPRVSENLARALARSGTELDEAEQMAQRLLELDGATPAAGHLRLMALVHAKRGVRSKAKAMLAQAGDEDDESGLADEVARELGAEKKKQKKKAR